MAQEQFEYNLTAKEILEKEFKTGLRGYSPEDVDEFLDLVIKDYGTFTQEIEALQAENIRLVQELDANGSARREPAAAPSSTYETPVQPAGTTNFDILKRLSNLEKHVFGNKLDDKE
ncbi:cell division regulator GpsB [Listeria aquatica]|uniref:Cell cycle protein GpsB n=1 Tax=Listeria aquatica TaxID=1494960 RepID=A0A841ZPG8_9LIST|nr:cell division regulator GpsB [Listeria aquatica]MBC1520561.1 cell division regulator GpsB [Listeria aquatica]